MNSKIGLVLPLLFGILASGCADDEPERWTISVRGVGIDVEVADSADEREMGFMYREDIPEGTGMLFVFPEPQLLSFWMKNTPVALTIAYIDESGRILEVYDMEPETLSPTRSRRPARYALEVPQGFFERTGIRVGDTVDLSNLPDG